MKKERNFVELLNKLKDDESLLSLLFVSLISSDTLLTKEDCENSINYLMDLKEALPKSELSEEKKKEYLEFCEEGLEICKRDYDKFSII